MGGFNPISTVLSTVGQVVGATKTARQAYGSYRNVASAYEKAQDNYAQGERDISEKDALQKRQIQTEADEAARLRRDALRRAVAKQQAGFGGQGIDTTDGSGEAVLLGLYQESEEEKKYRQRLDQLKTASLEQDNANKRRRNLLNLQQNFVSARDGLITNLDSFI